MAVVLAVVFLGEPIRPGQVVGGAIIMLGVALTRRRVARAGRAATAVTDAIGPGGRRRDRAAPPVPPLAAGRTAAGASWSTTTARSR